MSVQQMFIYISGPYSPPESERDPNIREQIILKNIDVANDKALAIVDKGHIPFVPHTMMRGWEDVYHLPRERALQICHRWLEKCDAFFYIASSEGADSEYNMAADLGLRIFHNLDEIADCT